MPFGGQGGEVGPALDNIGATLNREELLRSLVDPSSAELLLVMAPLLL